MSEQIGLKLTEEEMSPKRKGDFAEYYAVTWLWDQGFEVFKNAGCTGSVDMIAWDKTTGETILIDVKTVHISKTGGRNTIKNLRTEEQQKQNVRLLQFWPDTRKLNFTEHTT